MSNTWETMAAEFRPNGGSSMKDAITRIETRQLIAEQRGKALYNDAIFGIWESDETGKCTYANRTYQRIVGRGFEDLEGWGWTNIISSHDKERVTQDWAQALNQQREFQSEFHVQHPDGKEIPVVSVGHPLKDRAGKLKGYIGQLVTSESEDNVFFSIGN